MHKLQLIRRNGRREAAEKPPNWHNCMVVGSADAASAAVPSLSAAAANWQYRRSGWTGVIRQTKNLTQRR
ncbi:MAG: hypothetical protein H0X30_33310 [Anaerolineae bacterium]|nr:hypothetical protein [Anaerolineae bacterium]